MKQVNIVFVPKSGIGGPQSFVRKFVQFIRTSDCFYSFFPNLSQRHINILLATPCFPKLFSFIFSKLHPGTRHIARLDSFFSLLDFPPNIFHYFLQLYYNVVIYIQALASDVIVFQSFFLMNRYQFLFPFHRYVVIHNPFDIEIYDRFLNQLSNHPSFLYSNPAYFYVCVEGVVKGSFANSFLSYESNINTLVFGDSSAFLHDSSFKPASTIKFFGLVDKFEMYETIFSFSYQNNALPLFICLEERAACPNSVIESLSLGIPVIGLDDGSLPELVSPMGGLVLDSTQPPESLLNSLNKASISIISSYRTFSTCASSTSIQKRSPNLIYGKYLDLFNSLV